MRLVAGVDAPVGVEGGGGAEALGADVANVRLLARVGAQVARKQRGPVELLAAVLAWQHCSLAYLLAGLLGRHIGQVEWRGERGEREERRGAAAIHLDWRAERTVLGLF